MKILIQQLIKTLNSTEAGRTKTNDSYLRMSYGVDAGNFFENEASKKYNFSRKKDNSDFELRVEQSHDGIRIYNMGKLTNSKIEDLWAGDKIILEKRIFDGQIKYYIDCEKKTDSIVFQSFKGLHFELLTPQTFDLLKDCKNIKIQNMGKDKKRKDSDEIDIWDLYYNNEPISPRLSDTELMRITIKNNDSYITKTKSWEYYQFEMEA